MLGDLAAELVSEYDLLVGATEAVVAGAGGELGPGVEPVAGVEIGATDAAAQNLEPNLPGARHRLRELHHLERSLLAADRPHRATSVRASTEASAVATRSTWPSVISGKNGSAIDRAATSSHTGNSPSRCPNCSR